MLPKINFKYSHIYQEVAHLPKGFNYNKEKDWVYVNKFIIKLRNKWNKKGNSVLKYLEKITGLKWKEKQINCYILKISKYHAFSDPLTIPIQMEYKHKIYTKEVNRVMDILIHELIHNLFVQNRKKTYNYFQGLHKKYKNLEWTTQIHIPLHAIHKEVFDKFFDKSRLKYELYLSKLNPLYSKAWDIILKEGSKNILDELKKRCNK